MTEDTLNGSATDQNDTVAALNDAGTEKDSIQSAETVPGDTDTIEDAVIVEENASDTFKALDETETASEDSIDAGEESPQSAESVDRLDAASVEGTAKDAAAAVDEVSAPPAPVPAPPPAEPQRRGGFFTMLFGGIIAGLIGFAAAYYLYPQLFVDQSPRIAAQETALSELTARLDTVEATANGIDLAPLSAQIDNLTSGAEAATAERAALASKIDDQISAVTASLDAATGRLDGLDTALATLDERLTTLEKRPIADNVSREAIAAYERELAALQAAMAAERGSIEELLAQQKAEIERIADEASQMEERALAETKRAASREALARVQLALDSGEPFDGALADFTEASGSDIPEALNVVAADGVATLDTLRTAYPDAARAALGAARDAGESGDQGGVIGFLQAQVGARSVEPREGNSTDAVLSRIEDAVKRDALTEALTEVEALPASSRAQISDWEAAARARLAAVTAAAGLAADLN